MVDADLTSPAFSNPYVGPRPFEVADRDNFFGRNQETRRLISLIIAQQTVLFYAGSGAGKTSLLKAQLIPTLNEGNKVTILPIGHVGRIGGELAPDFDASDIENIFIFNTLSSIWGPEVAPPTLLGQTLAEGLEAILTPSASEVRPRLRLLILDQFEELFTTYTDRYQDRVDFFNQLRECLLRYPQLRLLLAMREDFLAYLDPYAAQLPDRLRTHFRLERLNREAALAAVREPAARAGRRFADLVAENLVDNLRRIQVRQHPLILDRDNGDREPLGEQPTAALGAYVEPVHLQIVCRQLWDRLPAGHDIIQADDVLEFGDVDQALRLFYESALRRVLDRPDNTISERRLRLWFEQHLITSERTRGLVHQGETETKELPNAIIEILDKAYIIRPDIRGGDTWYELAHDRLVEPILESNRQWREANQKPLTLQAQAWRDHGRDPNWLLTGKQLDQLRKDIAEDELDDLEKEFLAACEEEQRRAEDRKKNRILIIVLVIAFFLVVLAIWALVQKQAADTARGEAEHQRQLARASNLAIQSQSVAENQINRITSLPLLLALEAVSTTRRVDGSITAEAEAALRSAIDTASPWQTTLSRRHSDWIWSVDWSHDGQYLVSAGSDQTARIWDAQTGQEILVIQGHGDKVRSAAWSPDDTRLVTASDDLTARIWETGTGQEVLTLSGHEASLWSAAWSPDGQRIVTASADQTARIWDASTGRAVQTLYGHTGWVWSAAWSPDSKFIVTAGDDRTARIWDANTGGETKKLEGHTDRLLSAVWSPDGRLIATTSADKTARIWDVETGQVIQLLAGHTGLVWSAAWSPDSKFIVTTGDDWTARMWDVQTGQQVGLLEGHTGAVLSAAWSPDDQHIVTGSADRTIYIWRTHAQPAVRLLAGHTDEVSSAAWSPDGKMIVTTSKDQTAHVWDVRSGTLITVLKRPGPGEGGEQSNLDQGHTDEIFLAAWSPDGRKIVTASADRTARIWDVASSRQIGILAGHELPVLSAAWSPDGRKIVTASDDNTARIWDAQTGEELHNLNQDDTRVWSAAWNSEGTQVATVSALGFIRIWDERTGQPFPYPYPYLQVPPRDEVQAVAWSPDDRMLATTAENNTVRLWDVATGTKGGKLEGHTAPVLAIAWSPDGYYIATASADQTVRIWNAETGEQVRRLEGHRAPVRSVAWSPDGNYLATASADQTARIWLIPVDMLIDLARARIQREPPLLTTEEKARYSITGP